MSGYFDFEFRSWTQWSENFNKLVSEHREKDFLMYTIKEIGLMVLAGAKLRTPVGVYPSWRGRVGGTLRREWKISNVEVHGDSYEITVFNNTYYADWVENGHNVYNQHGGPYGSVEGQYMLAITIFELEDNIDRILQGKFEEFLSKFMEG